MFERLLAPVVALCLLASAAWSASVTSSAPVRPDPNNPAQLQERVVKLLRTTDKAQLNRYVPKAYSIRNVNPGAIAPFVLEAVRVEEGLIDTFTAPDARSGVLLICVPEYQIPMFDELIANLDRPELDTSTGSKYAYVQLRNRRCNDAGFIASLFQYGAGDNTITPDVGQNGILVEGPPSGVDAILAAIHETDFETPQTTISVKIYEVETRNDGSLGFDFHAWKNGPGRALATAGAFGEYAKVDYGRGVEQGLLFDSGAGTWGLPQRRMNTHGYSGAYYLDVPSAFFDFLAVKGRGEVLTEASTSVMNGDTAFFSSAEEILYYRVGNPPQTVAGGDTAGILPEMPGEDLVAPGAVGDRRVTGDIMGRQLTADQAGVFLWVTPLMGTEELEMHVRTAISDYLGFDDLGVPLLNRREMETVVRGRSGDEIVIGGMTRKRQVKTTRKVPVLGSLPVLGYLFGGEIVTTANSEIVQVLTPTCIEGCGGVTPGQEALMKAGRDRKLEVDVGVDRFGYDMFLIDRERYEE